MGTADAPPLAELPAVEEPLPAPPTLDEGAPDTAPAPPAASAGVPPLAAPGPPLELLLQESATAESTSATRTTISSTRARPM
jgi:hypothetical protein